MPDPSPMFLPKPFSLLHARSMFGGTDPKKIVMLIRDMFWDYYSYLDDCDIVLDANRWTTAVTAGGAPTAFALNVKRGGAFRGATGATDNGVTAIVGTNEIFDAADNPFMIIRWLAPAAVSGFSFEIGFSDPKTDEALPGCTDIDTPATGNGITDMIAVHMDTDQTLTTAALVADGTTGAAAKTDLSTYAPTVDTWQEMMIGFRANIGYCAVWDNGALVGNQIYSVAQGPDSAILVNPYALFRTRNVTSKQIDIDYIFVGHERNATA